MGDEHPYTDNRENLRSAAVEAIQALARLETHDDATARARAVRALRNLEDEAMTRRLEVRAMPPLDGVDHG